MSKQSRAKIKYQNSQQEESKDLLKRKAVTKILFDESHGELLSSHELVEDDQIDNWHKLKIHLESRSCEITSYSGSENNTRELSKELLKDYQILVLAAPRAPFSDDEIKAIIDFVNQGKSLLIAQCYQSLEDNIYSVNFLLEQFGLHTKPLLTNPLIARKIYANQFKIHYLSSDISYIVIHEPAYFKRLDKHQNVITNVVANLPRTGENFLVAVESGQGRVVAIGDFVIFGDKYIEKGDNQKLVLNIFKWLKRENSLECFNAQFEDKIFYGKTSTFAIDFKNPHSQRLENIKCLLESDTSAIISAPEQRIIRSLPADGQTHLVWNIEPYKLGFQSLRLTIDFTENSSYSPLFFDCAAYFQCIPEVEIDLVNLSHQNQASEIVETGIPFEIQAIARWANEAKQVPLQFVLKSLGESVLVESITQTETNRWRITAFDDGEWKISLYIPELDKSINRFIHAYPSLQKQINDIQRDITIPLDADVQHAVTKLRQEITLPAIQKTPFRLLAPEEQVSLLETPEIKTEILEVLQAARKEREINIPLVQLILENIYPTYSILHGCCIPYEPKLARHLVDVVKHHPSYKEHLAYNFMSIEGDERYGQTWLKQNLAAMLLHEKYGHGFFFTQTKLGKQIAILYRHRLEPGTDMGKLSSPYPRSVYSKYESSIRWIYDSALIVNEGFATWLEITVLPEISELIGQAAYRRKDFLFSQDNSMVELTQESEYFQKFEPRRVSKYREGCEYLELIQGYFGTNFGKKCAVQAMIKATEVDLGITEINGQIEFGLTNEELEQALLKDKSNNARSDERLRDIHDVLRNHKQEIWEQQEKLQCHRTCLHNQCPINSIISAKLNW